MEQHVQDARPFNDIWDTDVTGDLAVDFAAAVDQARWHDTSEGLAGKTEVVLVGRRTGPGFARLVAARLIRESDPRVSDPHGPAGAIPTTAADGKGWVFFGLAPVQSPPFHLDDAATAGPEGTPSGGN